MPPSRFLRKGYKARKYKENEEFKGMIKILFVCHGNICRSPMAEFLFKDYVKRQGMEKEFLIKSAATSSEEIGNPVHHGTVRVLKKIGISTEGKYAIKLRKEDYTAHDYFIGMDDANIRNMIRIFGGDPEGKIYKLLDFTDRGGSIADPWYSGDFEATYRDVIEGIDGLYIHIMSREGGK